MQGKGNPSVLEGDELEIILTGACTASKTTWRIRQRESHLTSTLWTPPAEKREPSKPTSRTRNKLHIKTGYTSLKH